MESLTSRPASCGSRTPATRRSLDIGLARLVDTASGNDSADGLCQRLIRTLVPFEGAEDDVAVVALHSAAIPDEISVRVRAEPSALSYVRPLLRRWLHGLHAGENEMTDIVLACNEAFANAIVHALSRPSALVELEARADDRVVTIIVRNEGSWRAPSGEQGGRGLAIMESSMDDVELRRTANGTEVVMRRCLQAEEGGA
jgi:anti-sigma regulatory factor (Ser/Thr protein kinase)